MSQLDLAGNDEIIYGFQEWFGWVVFAPRGEAESFARYCDALTRSHTWGEIRSWLTDEELAELLSQVYLNDDDPTMPPDAGPFDVGQIPRFSEGTWPEFPAGTMRYWLPDDIQEEFGKVIAMASGDLWVRINEREIESVANRLRSRGYRCTRDDALVARMNFAQFA